MEPFGVMCLRTYFRFEVNLPFLNSAAALWDTECNVFHFRTFKICPLFEEFATILGVPDGDGVPVA
ncbi:hypothetical protein K8353_49105, partial [Burkholderia contaminans]|nr:hypothetical protein [Burkholderia contaminans]